MLEGGEDPRFIARRMVILASEDVGNADPQALLVATAAAAAVDRVGLPECRAQPRPGGGVPGAGPEVERVLLAISRAGAHVRASTARSPRPLTFATRITPGRELGRGIGYVYPHDEPGGIADQPVMPDGLEGERFYEPTDRGAEAELGRRLDEIRRRRDQLR